jgi:hypothetical protein
MRMRPQRMAQPREHAVVTLVAVVMTVAMRVAVAMYATVIVLVAVTVLVTVIMLVAVTVLVAVIVLAVRLVHDLHGIQNAPIDALPHINKYQARAHAN